ncbi:Asparagine--tRNA ligase [Candidatus Erwinia haradaeae]|uniref:Asparagine--tRNA ligase n=1 Tax=Candidatus Erwinia haradaeae TaxID=1922217 RepID=A0A451CYJ6_9GAMM|nr:asparagine--tRNA ligase [Candidatus Erwinia haradaeae]VFP78474.1 Asparagine--tRNA ligase [Candidatus Erwinia haradaeae]
MNVISISDLLQERFSIEKEVTIRGWVRTQRKLKTGISFISLYDGSCFNTIQIVVNQKEYEILNLTTGCSLEVRGKVIESQGKGQYFEIQAINIKVIGWVENPDSYPMSSKAHSIEYLREMAHLRPRTNLIGAVARIRHTAAYSIHHFLNEQGFFWVSTPLITSANSEGAGDMFRVSTLNMENLPRTQDGKVNYNMDFFGQEAFLTVSGQLNAEAYASAISKIYTFGPTFRAEKSNTSRHLAEFWMLEPEVAFFNLEEIAALAESMMKYICTTILSKHSEDLSFLAQYTKKSLILRLNNLITTDFIHIDYSEAIKILLTSKTKFNHPIRWGLDLSSEHERYITEYYCQSPVIIKNYPKNIKAFYMRMNPDGCTVAAMDILAPGIGEIIGGSQREERLEILDQRLLERNMNKEDYWWYRDLRRYGTVPHSGFGLGFERLISYISGINNVRDVIAFPRTPRHIDF